MEVDWLACSSNTSLSRVTRAVPRTTIQCSARCLCDCSDSRAPGLTLIRLTWKPSSWSIKSEEHTSELQSLMRSSYAVFCLKKKNKDPLLTTHTLMHDI